MIGKRKTIAGLALLGALALCAFGAQGAQAAWETATNTTAFTCSPEAPALEFSDAHCTERGGESYGHEAIPTGTKTQVQGINEGNVVLKGSLLGAEIRITCKSLSTGSETTWLENVQTVVGEGIVHHTVHGTASGKFTECTLEGNGSPNCRMREPLLINVTVRAVEDPNTGAMAIEVTPDPEGSTTFVTIEFEGTGCLLTAVKIKGKARETLEGATVILKPSDEELTFGGNPATIEGKGIVRMAEGNPIAPTTVT